MKIHVESLRRRLKAWSPDDLHLQPLTLGRILTGDFPIAPGSPEEEMLAVLLQRAERTASTDREQ